MKAAIVPIGNSKGVRIPKTLLEQCRFGDEVELSVRRGNLVIMPSGIKPRAGWADAFSRAAADGIEGLLIPEYADPQGDWEW
jgi:antitoxin MazE